MTKRPTPLPPGEYTVTVDRVRKVRNKPLRRIYLTVVETGHKLATTIREDEA